MELLPQEIAEKLTKLYATEGQGKKAMVQVKFFTPDAGWMWYATEFDGEDLFFGLVIGHAKEYGYFSLAELQEARGPMGLPIERDLYFKPKSLEALGETYGP